MITADATQESLKTRSALMTGRLVDTKAGKKCLEVQVCASFSMSLVPTIVRIIKVEAASCGYTY